mmetsp:Transcript_95221/g.308341  ORF Transcript_95221/g.308341 Transcript_95221/m.308341 type:complete len:242 (+) Transcript_95221:2108-2833(+)
MCTPNAFARSIRSLLAFPKFGVCRRPAAMTSRIRKDPRHSRDKAELNPAKRSVLFLPELHKPVFQSPSESLNSFTLMHAPSPQQTVATETLASGVPKRRRISSRATATNVSGSSLKRRPADMHAFVSTTMHKSAPRNLCGGDAASNCASTPGAEGGPRRSQSSECGTAKATGQQPRVRDTTSAASRGRPTFLGANTKSRSAKEKPDNNVIPGAFDSVGAAVPPKRFQNTISGKGTPLMKNA